MSTTLKIISSLPSLYKRSEKEIFVNDTKQRNVIKRDLAFKIKISWVRNACVYIQKFFYWKNQLKFNQNLIEISVLKSQLIYVI